MTSVSRAEAQLHPAESCDRSSVCRALPTRHLSWPVAAVVFISALTMVSACGRQAKSTLPRPPSASELAQLWSEPRTSRDLYWGVGGKALSPDADATYKVIEIKQTGFSRGYTVAGPNSSEWSVKFPPEAPTEVVASRILWGVGYHQPPIYYVVRWTAENATSPNPQLPARFRERKPKLRGIELEDAEHWSYYRNPFVGTRELKGLLVLQAMLGNSDLKDDNNALYKLKEAIEGASTWYVARDLGHTFGRTGVLGAPRGDVEVFEQTAFIKGIVNGHVKFDWRGRHDTLFDEITPADVRWICSRLDRLTDSQWHEAFRAGGYLQADADRFIRRLKQKIAEGLALKG